MDNPQAGHPHSVGLHSGTEGDHEKRSVLKKVKDKAKKIKDTITKHGHGHEHGEEFEEENDEDEEMGEDISDKGRRTCESTVIKSRTIPVEELHAGESGPTLERTTAMKEDTLDGDALSPSQSLKKDDRSRQYEDNMGRPTESTQTFSSHSSIARHGEQVKEGIPRINLGESMTLEEDPHAPKDRPDPPNYQSKVADPTGQGGEEVGITPIISSFDKLSVQDKQQHEQRFTAGTGSHDQFSLEQLPAKTETKTTENTEKHSDQKTYAEKISTAAISAKNTVASKLGYGGKDHKGEEIHGGEDQKTGPSVTEYGKKIANTVTGTLSPVYGKVAGAGSAVMSKVHGTGSEGTEPEGDKGVSVKAYLAEKLKPGDEDRALSEVISDALHKRKEEPENEVKSEPTGKVTESEEVAGRLGTGDKPAGEGSDSGDVKFDSSSSVSSGSGMVDRIRGAVNSWFGKGGDSQTASEPIGSGNGGEGQRKEVAEK